MRRKNWSGEELEILRQLYTTDASFGDIVSELPGRSPNSIRLMASRLRLRRPDPTEEIHPATSIAFSEGSRMRGYLVRCSGCGSWIHTTEIIADGTLVCEACGAVCRLAS